MDRREVVNVGQALSEEEQLKHLSPWMKARLKVKDEAKINFCPYGCTVEDLDENSYCQHVVGFTTDKKFFEPFVLDANPRNLTYGRRRVMVPTRREGNKIIPILEPVLKSDHLERVTSTYVVYRKKVVPMPELPDRETARKALAKREEAEAEASPVPTKAKPGRKTKPTPEIVEPVPA